MWRHKNNLFTSILLFSCITSYSADQDRQVEALRKELTEVEEKLREANEQELPEEEYRVAAEEKRAELNKLMKEFTEMNLKGPSADVKAETGGGRDGGKPNERKHYERPSERRRRLEAKRREEEEALVGGIFIRKEPEFENLGHPGQIQISP